MKKQYAEPSVLVFCEEVTEDIANGSATDLETNGGWGNEPESDYNS